jgi:hypothetical protein
MKSMPVEIIKHSYMQTGNNEQQRMNRNEIMASKLTLKRLMIEAQIELWVQHLYPTK